MEESFAYLEKYYSTSFRVIMDAAVCKFYELEAQGMDTSVYEIADVVAEKLQANILTLVKPKVLPILEERDIQELLLRINPSNLDAVCITSKQIAKVCDEESFNQTYNLKWNDFYILDLWRNKWASGKPFVKGEDPMGGLTFQDESERVMFYQDEMNDRYTLIVTAGDNKLYVRFIDDGIELMDDINQLDYEIIGDELVINDKLPGGIVSLLKLTGLFRFWKGKTAETVAIELKMAYVEIGKLVE